MKKETQTFYEVFNSFSKENLYGFSNKHLKNLLHVCKSFCSLVNLPYIQIANEMFDAVIEATSNQVIQDNMRYLVTILDKYLETSQSIPIKHPTISEDQAVWMIISEKAALSCDKITNIIKNISGLQLPFKVVASKYLIRIRKQFSEETIHHRRNAIMKFESVFDIPIPDIQEKELNHISDNMPQYLRNHFNVIVNELFPDRKRKKVFNPEQEKQTSVSLHMYDQPASGLETTLQELYEIWTKEFSNMCSFSKLNNLKTGWKNLNPFWNRSIRSINILEIQELISELSVSSQQVTKQMYKRLEHLANGMDIIDDEKADLLVVDKFINTKQRSILEDQDIQNLKLHKGEWFVDITLVLYYTGFRAGELCLLKKTDADLNRMTLTGGSKTRWGVHRIIPIHNEIESIIQSWAVKEDSEWLVSKISGNQLSPNDIEQAVRMATSAYCSKPHIPHECRHTFYTKLQQGDRNSASCISKLMGHSSFALPVGIGVYSHPSPDMLRNAINSLK